MPRKKKDASPESSPQEKSASGKPRERRGSKGAKNVESAAATTDAALAHISFKFRDLDATAAPQPPRPSTRTRPQKTTGPRRPKQKRAQAPEKQEEHRATPSRRKRVQEPKQSERARVPQKPVRERFPVPEGAPRVIVLNGRSVLIINGRIVPPFIFFGNPSDETRAKTVFDEVRKAAQAGVHVHSLMIDFAVDEEGAQQALDMAGYLLDEVMKCDAEANLIFRLVFGGASGWEEKYPKAVFSYADGRLAEPSFSDESFWGEAARLLSGFVKALRKHEHAGRVVGLHLDRGEWFFANGWGYDTSVAAEEAFREWAVSRYNGDRVALQSAWFDGSARFETLKIPEYNVAPLSGEGFLRARRKERRWVDYHLFLSDVIVDRIQSLAYEVKKASEGWLLVAASYGYTFEWSHPASGHLSLGKLLRSKEVDIIAGPPSYRDRELGGAAAVPSPVDSFALSNKLFISEEDFKTPISKGVEPDEFNPVMQTPQALEAAHWRGVGSALVHGTGISWMDLWGNGWLNTPVIWQRAAKVRELLVRAMSVTEKDPDVAVLVDERSLAYLSDARAFKQLIQDSREAVLRAGVSAGFYLLTDLAHRKRFPDAKLYIFLNAWDIRPEVRAAIKSRLQRDGKTLFWVYSAGLFESGRPALERVREVTGIAIRPQPFNSRAGTTILNRKHPLTELLEERALSTVEQLEPSYFAIPEEGTTILGEYTQTGLPSFVAREIRSEEGGSDWRSVFLGEPLITERLIRGLCALAGVQVWNYHGDVVHVRPPFLAIHYSGTGHRIATLPDRWHAFDPISEKMIGADATHLRSEATDGASQILFVGEEAEVQELASLDAESYLAIGEIPEIEDDNVAEDFAEHDVPIISAALPQEYADMLQEEESSSGEDEPMRAASLRTPSRRKERRERKPKREQSAEAGIGFLFREKN